MSRADVWWTKLLTGSHNPSVARIINQTHSPLVVSDSDNFGHILSLSHLLEPKVKLQLFHLTHPVVAITSRDVFLYSPAPAFKEALQTTYRVELVDRRGRLWRLIRQ